MEEYFKKESRRADIRFALKVVGYAIAYLTAWLAGVILSLEVIIWWLKFRGII